ncbi:MAG: hypothetical protein ACMXYL_04580 [Candidatus Woesearchaeota archaeon]
MDATQLNRINELAREYLRLGIAKNTTDAVEKARFQLSFEAKPNNESQGPYDVLFKGMPEPKQNIVVRSSPSTQENSSDNVQQTPVASQDNNAMEETRKLIRQHEIRFTEQFMSLFDQQRKEMESYKARMITLENDLMMLKRKQKEDTIKQPEQQSTIPISSTIEQTIKGRTVRADDVAIDKIFYFGNK